MGKVSLTRRQRHVLGLTIIALAVVVTIAGAIAPHAGMRGGVLVITDQSIASTGASQGQAGGSWQDAIVLEGLGDVPVQFDRTSKHVIVRGARFTGDAVGISLFHASNVRVETSTFRSCGTGITIEAGAGIFITSNTFEGCQVGLDIDADTSGTSISLNNFTGNTLVARDASPTSAWSVDDLGNFYSNYMDVFPAAALLQEDPRLVSMFDGAVGGAFSGSKSYLIPLPSSVGDPNTACEEGPHGGRVDCFPLVFVPNHVPQIALNAPLAGIIAGVNPPAFNITAGGKFVTNVSYAINGMPFPIMTGFSLFGCQTYTGAIDPVTWATLPSGTVNISCQVETWFHKIAVASILMEKDITAPVCTVHRPLAGSVHSAAPAFNISTNTADAWSMQYRIGGSGTFSIPPTGTGTIDAAAWAAQTEGELYFAITAVDALNNTREVTVPVFKDTTPPSLSVAFPAGTQGNVTVHGVAPPAYTLTASDPFLGQCWYEVAGVPGFIPALPSGTIDAGAWASLGNGTITISFFANDTTGHVTEVQVPLSKDITAPIILIETPLPGQIAGATGPSFSITIVEGNLARAWLSVGGIVADYMINGASGTIPFSIWAQAPNGTVTITFHANDTAGNLGESSVAILHDICAPAIMIDDPIAAFTYGLAPPPYNVTIEDGNVAFARYSIDGGVTWFDLGTGDAHVGTIDTGAWHALPLGNWTFLVQAGDLGGNVASASVQCERDPAPPLIKILSPPSGIFGNASVTVHLSVIDDYLSHVWYVLNGTAGKFDLPSLGDIEATIDVSAWLACPDGEVAIAFHANDTLGNLEVAVLVVTKDTSPAAITITSPGCNALFGRVPPEVAFTVTEHQWAWALVRVVGYANTFLLAPGQSSVTFGEAFWTGVQDGNLTIVISIDDVAGNQAQASVQVRKDSTAPVVQLVNLTSFIWGIFASSFTVNATDANPAIAHYTIDGAPAQYSLAWDAAIEVSIDPVTWATLGDGTHVVTVTCADEGGARSSVSVTLEKDVTCPTISIQYVKDGDLVARDAPHLCVVARDPHLVPGSIEYSLDGGKTFYALGECDTIDAGAWAAAYVPGGTMTILVRAKDVVNNIGEDSVTVTCAGDPLPRVSIDTMLLLALVILASILVGLHVGERKGPRRGQDEVDKVAGLNNSIQNE